MTPQLRRANGEDVEAILALWRRAESTPSVTDTGDDLRRALDMPYTYVVVALDDGVVVGSLIATFDGWRGNLYRMSVDPRHRRAGLALALVSDAEQWLRAAGAKRVTALVEGANEGAQSFWDAAGFGVYDGMLRFVKTLG